jgi:cytochrome c556
MKRIVLAVAMIAVGVTAVVAQSDPLAARKALMKANNDNARNLVRITRGEEPYDAAKVNAAHQGLRIGRAVVAQEVMLIELVQRFDHFALRRRISKRPNNQRRQP